MVEQSDPSTPRADPTSAVDPGSGELADLRRQVAAYVAAGADESVQRVISAVHRVSRRLNQWYDQQLADLDVSGGEWTVLSEIARADGNWLTPTQLARLGARGTVVDDPPPGPDGRPGPGDSAHPIRRNRTRILVGLTEIGWALVRRRPSGSPTWSSPT